MGGGHARGGATKSGFKLRLPTLKGTRLAEWVKAAVNFPARHLDD